MVRQQKDIFLEVEVETITVDEEKTVLRLTRAQALRMRQATNDALRHGAEMYHVTFAEK